MGYNSAPGGYVRTTYGRNSGNLKVFSGDQEEQVERSVSSDEVSSDIAQEEVSVQSVPLPPSAPLRDYTLPEYKISFNGQTIEPTIPKSFGVQEDENVTELVTQEHSLVVDDELEEVLAREVSELQEGDCATARRRDELTRIEEIKKELGAQISKEQYERVINNEQVANQVYEMIGKVLELSGLNLEKAPFRNYKENNETSCGYVRHDEIETYLGKKLFFDTEQIDCESMDKVAETNNYDNEKPLQIPVDLIVNAAGFESWMGREVSSNKTWKSPYGYGEAKSFEIIKHYAGLPTELPPVGTVQMYVQPNGKIFFDNNSGDSHRIAAAILRGKKYIEATNVIIYKLSKNYILDSILPVPDIQ